MSGDRDWNLTTAYLRDLAVQIAEKVQKFDTQSAVEMLESLALSAHSCGYRDALRRDKNSA